MNVIPLITCFFLFFVLMAAIISLIFREMKAGKVYFFNCAVLLAALLPHSLVRTGFMAAGPVSDTVFTVGVSAFPLAFALHLKNHTGLRNRWIIPLPALCAAAVPLICLVGPGLCAVLLPSLLIAGSFGALVLLFYSRLPSWNAKPALTAALTMCAALAALSLYTAEAMWLLAGMGAIFVTVSALYLISNYRRTMKLSRQLRMAKQLNREMIHTVSRLKQKAEQLKKVIHEKDLELLQMSKHASLAEITTGIAHELTQPLTGIKGIAQNMIDDINLDDFDKLQAASELLRISSLVDKSSSIIDHIRNFSKKGYMNMQPVDINRVILDAIDLINLQFRKQNIDIILILKEEVPSFPGDKISLEQLFINFLLNARDAITEKRKTEPDDYNGAITISTEHDHSFVRVLIKDNGIGIPQDNMKKIWSPFFTTKHRSKSTGMGLSIIRKIVKEHRASISVESVFGEGATFSIGFPVKKETPASAPAR